MSLLARLNRLTPNLLFYSARTGRGNGCRKLRAAAVAQRSGLSKRVVLRLARQRSWAAIPLGQAEAFARGCGERLGVWKGALRYLRERGYHVAHSGRVRYLARLIKSE